MSAGWQASALARDGDLATRAEVEHAMKVQGLDPTDVEWEGIGLWLIPLTDEQEDKLKETGSLEFEVAGVEFRLEMP